MQPADYDRFKPFFSKVLADYHKVDASAKHTNNWDLAGVEGLPEDGKLDLAALGLPALSMRVRVGRNLADFPLPGAMSKQNRIDLEAKMCQAFDKLKAMPEYGGRYHSLTPGHVDHISDAEYEQLVKDHIMFKDMAADPYLATAGIASDWPFGRGCYVSADRYGLGAGGGGRATGDGDPVGGGQQRKRGRGAAAGGSDALCGSVRLCWQGVYHLGW